MNVVMTSLCVRGLCEVTALPLCVRGLCEVTALPRGVRLCDMNWPQVSHRNNQPKVSEFRKKQALCLCVSVNAFQDTTAVFTYRHGGRSVF